MLNLKKTKMTEPLFLHFTKRKDWHQWLLKNHSKFNEIWLIYFKNKASVKSITYEDSVDEALCFGWIDSIIKKIDDTKYARKFTLRTNPKKWSDLNIKRVRKLMAEGLMNKAGLDKIDKELLRKINKTGFSDLSGQKKLEDLEVPKFIINFFEENEPALKNFNKLAATYKRHYVLWITNAKKDDTIRKRLIESVILLKENKKLGLK
jgi:uncharacterized protein YdeI (YjbR/CyaY-like superfamily)